MSGSNVEETSEQTHGRETEPTARGRGRKDKSRDAVANMEARHGEGLRGSKEQIQDLRERVLVSQVQPVSREEFVSFQGKAGVGHLQGCCVGTGHATQGASRVEVPKPQGFSGKRDAKELDNFLWHMERYFEAIALTDEAAKVRTATLYLTDTATLWWRRRFADMEKDICTIETWEDFKREIKRQFYPEDVAYLARKNMRRLKHTGRVAIQLHDNLQGWAEQELRRRGVQDLATAMTIVESLADYKRGDSSKIESLEDSHAMGGGDEDLMDHNAPKKGSGKTPNVREGRDCPKRKALSAMIEEREQEDEAHMGSMQLLGALQFDPKPSTPKTSLLAGVKQHSKHRKCTGLHPSEASWEKEVKNILAERVTRRQGVPPVIEYLVQWKGLPKRQVSWEHADALRRFWKHIERGGKLLETPGAIYTKSLVGRVWKVLEMPRDVHTSLHYGGRHGRSPRLSRDF
ncbi:hypothetical protein CK203_102631 [Vitis vinifera]|uniref:Chromo domain-containing protein n=1 Tax=Vitis vinifera TaxID=29760 RepID=A0A438CX96_VITVI|nr:hypothetical protein CK203_102631 [Vitis vinifera]